MSMINKLSVYRVVTAADTNAAVVKSGPAVVQGLIVAGSSSEFLKIYDKATVPDENDTPLLTIALSDGMTELAERIQTENGLSVRVTGAVGDTDTTSATASQVIQLLYK